MFEPEINLEALPVEEQTDALHIKMNLAQMRMCVNDFRHSLDLYFFAKQQIEATSDRDQARLFASWIGAAARNGAQMAYAVERLMEAINKAKVPSVRKLQDMARRDIATALFAKEFPDIAGIRTTAAHPSEFSKSRDEMEKHAVPGGIVLPGLELEDGLQWSFASNTPHEVEDGVALVSSFKGRTVSYELTIPKLRALEQVVKHFTRSFDPLEHPKLTKIREEWLRTGRPPWGDQIDRLQQPDLPSE